MASNALDAAAATGSLREEQIRSAAEILNESPATIRSKVILLHRAITGS